MTWYVQTHEREWQEERANTLEIVDLFVENVLKPLLAEESSGLRDYLLDKVTPWAYDQLAAVTDWVKEKVQEAHQYDDEAE